MIKLWPIIDQDCVKSVSSARRPLVLVICGLLKFVLEFNNMVVNQIPK